MLGWGLGAPADRGPLAALRRRFLLQFDGLIAYSALGAEHSLFARLGRWHPRLGSPVWSLVVQWAIILGMIAMVGTDTGRAAINGVLEAARFDPLSWEGHGGFETLLRCTAPVFWLFFLFTGLSLFVLREKNRGRERPFSVPLYPVLPIIFCNTCAYMLYAATDYAGRLTFIGVVPLLIGFPLYALSTRRIAVEE